MTPDTYDIDAVGFLALLALSVGFAASHFATYQETTPDADPPQTKSPQGKTHTIAGYHDQGR